MKRIEILIKSFEDLVEADAAEICGGFVTVSSMENGSDEKKDKPTEPEPPEVNYFQCGCNNYCKPVN